MARRPARFLVLLVACGIVLPGCAQWGSWFSSGKASTPANQVQPANQGHQFGAKKPSGLQALVGKGKPSEPPAPPAKPRTPEEIKASQMAMARLCERRGELDQAEAIYQTLVKKYPQEAMPHHRLGVLAVQKGRFSEAEEHFRRAQEMAPPSADLLSDLGYTYYLEHRLPEAEGALRQALAKDPQHAAATNNLALVVGAQGRFDESLTLFRRTGSEAQAFANLAFVLSQYGDLKRAEEAYLRALTLDNTMRPAAHAVLQVAERRRVEEQLAARHSAAQGERPSTADQRPAAPKDGPLATVVEGRPTPPAVRRIASAAERRPVAGGTPPSTPDADGLAAAEPPAPPTTNRQPLASAGDPVEPDVDEVVVSEPVGQRDGGPIRSLPATHVATDERGQSVQKTSFESAMAELEAALTQPRLKNATNRPASAASERRQ